MGKIKLDKIEDAIKSIKEGEIIIVVDDENRENEGDFITAAETIDASKINFMAKNGRGLICVPMSEKLCSKLNLEKLNTSKINLIHDLDGFIELLDNSN